MRHERAAEGETLDWPLFQIYLFEEITTYNYKRDLVRSAAKLPISVGKQIRVYYMK